MPVTAESALEFTPLGDSDHIWDVLISHNGEQARDIPWLRDN
jgi:hypothetical protein